MEDCWSDPRRSALYDPQERGLIFSLLALLGEARRFQCQPSSPRSDSIKTCLQVIAPGFHALYWEAMVKVFTQCSERSILKIEELLHGKKTVELDLEARVFKFCSKLLALVSSTMTLAQ
ncbi:hypothetical protein OIU85_028086 [Salix viminalis]|uniref:Uncharacterized protein n=1 Tax=Salix viminalis TaxID=40686 RepID=A0A9Q0QJB9_SALVM|nr:hypothetical protein OIU85_028086 [Salix viminalis]